MLGSLKIYPLKYLTAFLLRSTQFVFDERSLFLHAATAFQSVFLSSFGRADRRRRLKQRCTSRMELESHVHSGSHQLPNTVGFAAELHLAAPDSPLTEFSQAGNEVTPLSVRASAPSKRHPEHQRVASSDLIAVINLRSSCAAQPHTAVLG